MQTGDTSAALAALDAAFAADADLEAKGYYQRKLMLLMQRGKVEDVDAYVRDLLKRHAKNDDIIGFASACIVATSEDSPRFDAKLALETARITAAAAAPDSRWQQFARWRLGWANWHVGEKTQAVEQMLLALDSVKNLKAKIDFSDLDLQCEDALRYFRK